MLTALLETAGVPAAQHGDALVALDKLDKIGAGRRGDRSSRRAASPADAGAKALSCLRRRRAGDAATRRWRALARHPRRARRRWRTSRTIVGLAASTPAAGRIRVDPSLARGLSYYTGAIMEIAVEGIGSLGGGGRYDNLVGMFLGRDVPACGFSLGLERIIVVMTERDMFPAGRRAAAPWTSW